VLLFLNLTKLNGSTKNLKPKNTKRRGFRKSHNSVSSHSLGRQKFDDALYSEIFCRRGLSIDRPKKGFNEFIVEKTEISRPKAIKFLIKKEDAIQGLESSSYGNQVPWHEILHHNVKRPSISLSRLPDLLKIRPKIETTVDNTKQDYLKPEGTATRSESCSSPVSDMSFLSNNKEIKQLESYTYTQRKRKIAKIVRQKCMKILSPRKKK